MTKKVLLSTDIGSDIDDALALHIAMKHPEIDLCGIYTTHGDVEIRAKIAQTMIDLENYSSIVGIGERNALEGKPLPFMTGLEQYAMKTYYKTKTLGELGIIENGVEDLITKLKSKEYIIASIAPLTNIAKALEIDPSLNRSKTEVYIMGGRVGNTEHNFRHDVKAAKKVLESKLNLTILSGDLCGSYLKPVDEFKLLKSSGGQYIQEMFSYWNTYITWRKFATSGISFTYSQLTGEGKKFPRYFRNVIDTLNDSVLMRDHPKEYIEVFNAFISIIRKYNEESYKRLTYELEANLLNEVTIHDIYVIYAIAHPDKLITEKTKLTVDVHGVMSTNKGKKHTLVTGLDIDHFKSFLKEYLI